MDKRVVLMGYGGHVFQRGLPLTLPVAVPSDAIAKQIHAAQVAAGRIPADKPCELFTHGMFVVDIGLMVSEDQENVFQIIALPAPNTALLAADKAMIVDVPERLADLVVYSCKASEAKSWITDNQDRDKRQAEEDREEEDEDDDNDEEEEEEEGTTGDLPQGEPVEAELLGPGMLAVPPPPQLLAPAVPDDAQIEVIAPIPLQLDVK